MKKYVVITLSFIATIFTSCSSDSNDSNYLDFSYKRISIHEVIMPNEFIRGENAEITVSYYRPSDCHSFSGFDYDSISNERTISVINVVVDNPDCNDLGQTSIINKDLNFSPGSEDSYIFRFWQGKDDQGNNQFLTIEVPVRDIIID